MKLVISLGILAITLLLVYTDENMLPYPLSIKSDSTLFSEERAQKHLDFLSDTIGIRRAGEPKNEVDAANYIANTLNGIAQSSMRQISVEVDVQRANGSFSWINKTRGVFFKEPLQTIPSGHHHLYNNISNVIIRIQPQNATLAPLLLSAHYDTGKTSPGASDDTIHVAALMELARKITKSPSTLKYKRGVVILLNGAEEVGLLASHMFMNRHEWASDIGAWINLEATGTGGKLMYFRALGPGNGWMTHLFSAVGGYGTSIADDLHRTGLFPGFTDATVYGELFGLPGIDLVLYNNPYVYHSPLDNVDMVGAGCLQHIGDVVASMIDEIAVMDSIPNTPNAGIVPIFGSVSHQVASYIVHIVCICVMMGVVLMRRQIVANRSTVVVSSVAVVMISVVWNRAMDNVIILVSLVVVIILVHRHSRVYHHVLVSLYSQHYHLMQQQYHNKGKGDHAVAQPNHQVKGHVSVKHIVCWPSWMLGEAVICVLWRQRGGRRREWTFVEASKKVQKIFTFSHSNS